MHNSALLTAAIVAGIISIPLMVAVLSSYVVARMFAPEPGSNAHLRAHLLAGGTIENYEIQ